ncbi:uncharacterized protein LOC135825083 [Sycon ciliatum]|uniref:uncharacterized protein LOC135825083 n=1 Tax=Sycon ciliatum TaxID=27933 RepID=UPI0031F614A0
MGADYSQLDHETGPVSPSRTSTSSDDSQFEVSGTIQDWMVVTSKNTLDVEDRVLQFNPATSRAVCAGVGYSLSDKAMKKLDLGKSAEKDPVRLSSILRDPLGLPANHVEYLTSKSSDNPATMSNLVAYISDAAEKVGEDGLLLVSFSGHGEVHTNPDGSKSGVLIPADNPGSTTVNVLTARLIERSLKKCKARHIVIFLDCCHAGLLAASLAEDTVQSTSQSELYVLAACSTSEVSLGHSELGSGFFTFFTSDYLRRHGNHGQLPIGAAMKHCQSLCPAMAKLCVRSQREKASRAPGTKYIMHPLLRTKLPSLSSQDAVEEMALDVPDAAPRYLPNDELSTKFLGQFVSSSEGGDVGKKVFDRVPAAVTWLNETAMPCIQLLYCNGYLSPGYEEHREVMCCVVCLLSRSVATIYVDYGEGELSDPDMFLAFFTYIYHSFVQAVEDELPNKDLLDEERPKILNQHAILGARHYVAGLAKALDSGPVELRPYVKLLLDMKSGLSKDVDEDSKPTTARRHPPSSQQQHEEASGNANTAAVVSSGDCVDGQASVARAAGAGQEHHLTESREEVERILQRLELVADMRVDRSGMNIA